MLENRNYIVLSKRSEQIKKKNLSTNLLEFIVIVLGEMPFSDKNIGIIGSCQIYRAFIGNIGPLEGLYIFPYETFDPLLWPLPTLGGHNLNKT